MKVMCIRIYCNQRGPIWPTREYRIEVLLSNEFPFRGATLSVKMHMLDKSHDDSFVEKE